MKYTRLFLLDNLEFCAAILREDQHSEIALKAKQAKTELERLIRACDAPGLNAVEFRVGIRPLVKAQLDKVKKAPFSQAKEDYMQVLKNALREIDSLPGSPLA